MLGASPRATGMVNVLVNSCTRSLNSASSSLLGATNPLECLLDAARHGWLYDSLGRDLPIWRMAFVNALGEKAIDMVRYVYL